MHWGSMETLTIMLCLEGLIFSLSQTCTQIIVFAVPDTGKVVLKMMSNQIHYSLFVCGSVNDRVLL